MCVLGCPVGTSSKATKLPFDQHHLSQNPTWSGICTSLGTHSGCDEIEVHRILAAAAAAAGREVGGQDESRTPPQSSPSPHPGDKEDALLGLTPPVTSALSCGRLGGCRGGLVAP